MRSALFIFPFLALLIAAIGTAVGNAFTQFHWITYAGWGCAFAVLGLWVTLDFEGFKALFLRKGAKYGASSGLTVVLGILVIIGAGVLSNRPRFNKSYDATKAGTNTLSEQTAKILKTLKEKNQEITVTAFFQDRDAEQTFKDLMTLYQREADVLRITYLDPQKERTLAMSMKLTSGNTVILQKGNQESRLTAFTEEKLTNALVNVMKDGSKKVYFTAGHGEPKVKATEAGGYSIVVEELGNNRYEVADLSLLEKGSVPDDASLVVVAGPKYDLNPQEIGLLKAYSDKGGPLLIMLEAMVDARNLKAFAREYGIGYNDDLIILQANDPRAQLIGQNNAIVSEFSELNPVTKDFAAQGQIAVLIPNARSISDVADNPHSMKVELVAKTADVMIRVKDVRGRDDLRNLSKDRIEPGAFGVVAVATGKTSGDNLASNEKKEDADKKDVGEKKVENAAKDIRIVATGSSQFATNLGAQSNENRDLFLNIINYLLADEDFISIRPKDASKGTIDMTSPTSQLSLFLLAFIYPFVFLGGGALYWLKRRRA